MNKITIILFVFIALVFSIISTRIAPPKFFNAYTLELDSVWQKNDGYQDYIIDIDNNENIVSFHHEKINNIGNSIVFKTKQNLTVIYIFQNNEFFISKSLHFADINNDNFKDIMYVSCIGDSIYLNILEYIPTIGQHTLTERVPVSGYSKAHNFPEVENFNIKTLGSNIYFDINAGYSVFPRNIYKYNYNDKILLKSPRNSMVCFSFENITYQNNTYTLVNNTMATSNTRDIDDYAEKLRDAKSKEDTLKTTPKPLFQYGDFASYIVAYTEKMNYAFPPIEFKGATNYTISKHFVRNDSLFIVAITNTQNKENEKEKLMTICDVQGNITKQIPLPYNFAYIFTSNDYIAFGYKEFLYLYSLNLDLIKIISGLSSPRGFFDLNNNSKDDFFAYEKNNLVIYSDHFKHKTSYHIEREYSPFSQRNGVTTFHKDGQNYFLFNSKQYYYLFNYKRNKYTFLKSPFYIFTFAFWLCFLYLIAKVYSQRLEKENQRLEATVVERTQKLQEKNDELAKQKTEIQKQAKKLSQQNKHLEELDNLKKTLTNTLVHDLKNPLGQIITTSNNKSINNLAKRMLLLITNMLDVNKYEQTEFLLNKENHSLKKIIEESIESHQISLQEKNLRLITTINEATVNVDKDVILRVLENLLSNATRFSPHNQSIEINTHSKDNKTIKITITNYGEKIPEDAISHIFEKYIQIKKGNTSSYHTTGLGLTFCKMAIEAHGHSIVAENIENGVRFSFELDGEIKSSTVSQKSYSHDSSILNDEERLQLSPCLTHLKTLNIYQTSDIIKVLNNIPDSTPNITTYKQQISNAVFTSNEKLFSKLVDL